MEPTYGIGNASVTIDHSKPVREGKASFVLFVVLAEDCGKLGGHETALGIVASAVATVFRSMDVGEINSEDYVCAGELMFSMKTCRKGTDRDRGSSSGW